LTYLKKSELGAHLKIFFPELSIAFEYQGEVHYFSSTPFGSATKRQSCDIVKHKNAKEIGITVIPIPFWWDKTHASLAATIVSYRPDVQLKLSPLSKPIPSNMPDKYLNRLKKTS
jgi:hypothetical protein